MHNNAVAGNRLEDDEVAHVPVEDRGPTQLVQMLELVSERPAKQMQLARPLNQSTKRNPVQRYGMPSSQRVQVELVTVIGRYHCEASEAAFRSLGLLDHRQLAMERKSQQAHGLHPYTGERTYQPAHERTLFEDDVGSEQHVGLQRSLFASGIDVCAIERRYTSVCRFVQRNSAARVRAAQDTTPSLAG